MAGGGKGGGARPPDPVQTARGQTSTSIMSALANANLGQVNQVTPTGSLTYDQTGSTTITDPLSGQTYEIPRYTATQRLSPQQQRISNILTDANENAARGVREASVQAQRIASKPISFDGLPEGGSADNIVANGDFSADRRRVEDALYSRLTPALERGRESLRSSLISQGVREGSEAYDRAMARFGEQENDARMQVVLGAGQEQDRLSDLAFRLEGRRDLDRGVATNEMMTQRDEPLRQMGALLGMSGVQNPSFVNTPSPQIPTVDYAGMVQNQYAQRQQSQGDMMGGLLGLAGNLGAAAIGLSDERAKTDVEQVGEYGDLPVYSFRYKEPKSIGFMAQDVEKIAPGAVMTGRDGLKRVDYTKAMRAATA